MQADAIENLFAHFDKHLSNAGYLAMGGHRKRVLEPHRALIVERINPAPHLTLHGLKAELAARGVKMSHGTVWQFLRREGLRFKKNAVRP